MALATDTSERLASILDIFRGGEGGFSDAESEQIVADAEAGTAAAALGGTTSAFDAKAPEGGYDITYQPATRAASGAAPGTVALQNRILQMFGGSNGGIFNNRNVGGTNTLSVHAEGRAGDVMVGSGGAALGNRIGTYLVENARLLGVQEVIFNRQRWTAATGWRPYRGQNPHVDHVHYSMTREAAGQVGNFAPAESHGPTTVPKQPATTVERLGSILDIIRGGDPNRQTTGASTHGMSSVRGTVGGGSATLSANGTIREMQEYARSQLSVYGLDPSEMGDLIELVQRESSWNPQAANPSSSARGLFQKMTSLHGAVESTYQGQIAWGLKYIRERYGSISAALAFHRRNNYY